MRNLNPKTTSLPTTDSSITYGISKATTIGKACKSFVRKLQPDKNKKSKEEDKSKHKKGTSKVHNYEDSSVLNVSKHNGENDLYNCHRQSVDDNFLLRPKLSCLSSNMSRRSKTPSPLPRYRSRTKNQRSRTPAFLTRMTSRKTTSEASSPEGSLSRSASRKPEVSLNASKKFTTETETPKLWRNMSVKGSTPIIFSKSSVRGAATPIEKKLECTMEELCFGSTKTIKIARDAIKSIGIVQEEETLTIEVKPGWRKGTKITFEGKGDEKPGFLPADIVFVIDEVRHSLFRREGDDLELGINIPLVSALTGFTIPVPLLGGEKMNLTSDDIVIFHGYEKVIQGQGMPDQKLNGRRGDLRIKFLVTFPEDLSDEQRKEAVSILQDCC